VEVLLYIPGGAIGIIIVLICVVYCIVQYVQNWDVKRQYIHTVNELTESNEQKSLSISTLFGMLEAITSKKAYYKKRVEDLESSIKTGFGLSVRNDITIVNTDLLKLDFVIMLAGVMKMIKDNPNQIEDAEYYISLTKRIQAILDKMPEIQEKKGAREIINGI